MEKVSIERKSKVRAERMYTPDTETFIRCHATVRHAKEQKENEVKRRLKKNTRKEGEEEKTGEQEKQKYLLLFGYRVSRSCNSLLCYILHLFFIKLCLN